MYILHLYNKYYVDPEEDRSFDTLDELKIYLDYLIIVENHNDEYYYRIYKLVEVTQEEVLS